MIPSLCCTKRLCRFCAIPWGDGAWFARAVTVVASGLVPDVVPVGDEPRRYRLTLSLYLPALLNHAPPASPGFRPYLPSKLPPWTGGSSISGMQEGGKRDSVLDGHLSRGVAPATFVAALYLSLIHISEPTRLGMISYAVF